MWDKGCGEAVVNAVNCPQQPVEYMWVAVDYIPGGVENF